ncbi:hypothetical protein Btru_039783 [Bulinus truncatus]|nr:hypothetical protein Btru_039783 [Bulinus truncatus]
MVEQSRRLLVQHFMRYEVLRARTFTQSDLPTGLQFSLIQIANAGFYNDIEQGCIYCFDCGSELTDQQSLESAHGRGCNLEIQNVPLREMTRGLSQEEMVQYFSLFCSHSSSEHQRPLRNVSSAHDTSMGNIVMNHHLQSSASNIQDHRTTQAGVLNESLDLANISLIPNTEIVQEDIETTVAPLGHSVPNEEARSVEETVFVTQADQDVHANEVGVHECEQNSSYLPDYAISLDPPLDISSPSYPQFASSEARRTSFTGWSHNNPQHPDELVACGFFYTGYTNCVRCFNCGLGLENWKPSDIPANQHALHKPNCVFNRMYRGQANIDKAQQEQTQDTTRSNVPTQSSQSEMTTQSSQSETTEHSTLFPNRKEVLRSETHSEVREKLLAVKTEHDILKNRLHCLICSTRQVTCLFLPCSHMC